MESVFVRYLRTRFFSKLTRSQNLVRFVKTNSCVNIVLQHFPFFNRYKSLHSLLRSSSVFVYKNNELNIIIIKECGHRELPIKNPNFRDIIVNTEVK